MKQNLLKAISSLYYLVKLSLFNAWRNRRRTVVTMMSIITGTITLILMNGYIEVIQRGLKSEAIARQYGNFQIAMHGYFDGEENSNDHLIDLKKTENLEKEILRLDSVDFINKRLHISGIIGTSRKSTVFMGISGQPEAESLMAPQIMEGDLLSESDPYGILIGSEMAKKLAVKIGDKLVLFVSSASGSQEAIEVTVRGIYSALMKEQERVTIYLPLAAGWDLILEKQFHRILVFLKPGLSDRQISEAQTSIRKVIEKNRMESRLELKSWESFAVFFKQVLGFFRGISTVIALIMFIIIGFNIHNTMHISIVERFREIGTMRAMGESRSSIVKTFVSEGFMIGLMGALVGICLAVSLAAVLNYLQLELPPGPGQDKPTPVQFYITMQNVMGAASINLLLATLASWLPARKGARINIVEALRFS